MESEQVQRSARPRRQCTVKEVVASPPATKQKNGPVARQQKPKAVPKVAQSKPKLRMPKPVVDQAKPVVKQAQPKPAPKPKKPLATQNTQREAASTAAAQNRPSTNLKNQCSICGKV